MSNTLLPHASAPAPGRVSSGDTALPPQVASLDADLYLGEVLLREELISQDELDEAFDQQKQAPYQPLGAILVERGLITDRQLKHVLGQRPQ